RLVLSRNGEVSATAQPYDPPPEGKVWKLRLAHTKLDSANALLRHKTSARQTFTHARSEYPLAQADEVLLSNERGGLCQCTIATPRLDCGLLAGVLRGEMIEHGKAEEAVFSWKDLKSARAIFVGNSLRGLIRACV